MNLRSNSSVYRRAYPTARLSCVLIFSAAKFLCSGGSFHCIELRHVSREAAHWSRSAHASVFHLQRACLSDLPGPPPSDVPPAARSLRCPHSDSPSVESSGQDFPVTRTPHRPATPVQADIAPNQATTSFISRSQTLPSLISGGLMRDQRANVLCSRRSISHALVGWLAQWVVATEALYRPSSFS